MIVRDATPADAAALAEVYRPAVTSGFASFELEPPDAAEMTGRLAKVQLAFPWLVGTDPAGAVLGYAYATRHRERPAYDWTAETSVYVRPSAQGRGVGRGLYQELLARLRAQGYRLAIAGIALPNPASVALHELLGFRRAGTLEGVGYKLGAWRDVGLWQLVLGAPPLVDGAPRPPRRP
ncbi:MAG: N-acetyltransferase family protein [Planctomycetota bacterium]